MGNNKPNIIWVFPDQMRGQAMSISGDENLSTPNLDRMAEEGVQFSAACSSYPVCVPFRFTLLTGERASSRWVPTIHWRMSPAETTIADVFNANGYQTSYVGKWHLSGGSFKPDMFKNIPVPRQYQGRFKRWKGFELRNNHFDSWYFCENDPEPHKIEGYQSDGLFAIAQKEIEEMNKDARPFFLVLSVETPHPPYHGPKFKNGNRNIRDINFRDNVNVEKLRSERPWLFKKNIWGYEQEETEEEIILKSHLHEYYSSIENIDENMGKLFDKLQSLEILKNTVVMFFSDHGELLGSHGKQGKQFPYEESINIPFIIRVPEKLTDSKIYKKCKKISVPIHTEDIFPTTLGFAGVDSGLINQKPGKNLVPWITGKKAPDREGVFLEFVEEQRDSHKDIVPPWRGYRTEKYKYAVTYEGPYMLFDLENDPYEKNNLVNKGSHRSIQEDMHEILMKHLEQNDKTFYYRYMNT